MAFKLGMTVDLCTADITVYAYAGVDDVDDARSKWVDRQRQTIWTISTAKQAKRVLNLLQP